jgi:hypothetical protein
MNASTAPSVTCARQNPARRLVVVDVGVAVSSDGFGPCACAGGCADGCARGAGGSVSVNVVSGE